MEIKAWKAYLAVTFMAGFVAAIIWGAYISAYQTSQAGSYEVILSTSAATATHKAGDEFPIQILLDTAGKNIVAVQAIFSFDKNVVQAISVDTSGSGFNYEIKNTIDADQGQGFLALAKPTPGANGTAVRVATVNLKALADIAEPVLRLKLDIFTAVSDSAAILDDGNGTNVLQKLAYIFPVETPATPPTAPSAPPVQQGDFDISSKTSLADTIVKIDWSNGSSENGNYIIERKDRKKKGADFAVVGEVGSGDSFYIDRGVKAKHAYGWRICQNSNSEKICTGEQALRTLGKKKIFKPRFTAVLQDGKVNLSWSPVYSTDFKVVLQRRVGKAKKFTTLSVITSDSENSYFDETVVPGTKYTYQIMIKARKKTTVKTKNINIAVP